LESRGKGESLSLRQYGGKKGSIEDGTKKRQQKPSKLIQETRGRDLSEWDKEGNGIGGN